ncbi:sigma-70 family RNA polymerase sigma factor [Isosphaeraceae bacterium EP7]
MDVEQLGRLIDGHSAALTLYARQWSGDPEDAVQDAFMALAALRSPPENPAAWLFRAVRNASINAGIAGKRRRRREAEVASHLPPWFDPDPGGLADYPLDPDEAQASLTALPDPQREVIVARLWGALTFEQIGELIGVSSSTAHRLYQTGLSTLRERLGVPCRPSPPRSTQI